MVVELAGPDRRGNLFEISAVLTSLKCNVVAAEMWTHNGRLACVVYVTDEGTNGPIKNAQRLSSIKNKLRNVLRANDDKRGVKMESSNMAFTHMERRLHQIMLADIVYQPSNNAKKRQGAADRPLITIDYCTEKEYSVVNISCKDRRKLLFDVVCTITDMGYVVFHASIHSESHHAYQVVFGGYGALVVFSLHTCSRCVMP